MIYIQYRYPFSQEQILDRNSLGWIRNWNLYLSVLWLLAHAPRVLDKCRMEPSRMCKWGCSEEQSVSTTLSKILDIHPHGSGVYEVSHKPLWDLVSAWFGSTECSCFRIVCDWIHGKVWLCETHSRASYRIVALNIPDFYSGLRPEVCELRELLQVMN